MLPGMMIFRHRYSRRRPGTRPTQAQTVKDLKCTWYPDMPWGEQIIGCTNVIDTGVYGGKDLAAAFSNRGKAVSSHGGRRPRLCRLRAGDSTGCQCRLCLQRPRQRLLLEREYELAIADYTRAISLDPNAGYAFNGRGNAYKAKGDLDQALADYDRTVRLDPNDAVAVNNRGVVYQIKGDFDRAIANYDEAVRTSISKYAVVFSNRGQVYQAEGTSIRAIADYDEAIRLNPNYASAFERPAAASTGNKNDKTAP